MLILSGSLYQYIDRSRRVRRMDGPALVTHENKLLCTDYLK